MFGKITLSLLFVLMLASLSLAGEDNSKGVADSEPIAKEDESIAGEDKVLEFSITAEPLDSEDEVVDPSIYENADRIVAYSEEHTRENKSNINGARDQLGVESVDGAQGNGKYSSDRFPGRYRFRGPFFRAGGLLGCN